MSLFSRAKQILRSYLVTSSPPPQEYTRDIPNWDKPPQTAQSPDPTKARYYAALELPYGAPFEHIKSQHKKLMAKYHPDRFHGKADKQPLAEELSAELNEAYQYFKKLQQKGEL